MNIEITLIFTTILSVFMLVLAARVINLRISPATKLMQNNETDVSEETLNRAVRGHGNLVEYAPLFLFLMLILEINNVSDIGLYISGTIFTIGRLMHGIVFSFMTHNPIMRIGGMSLTFLGFILLIVLAVIDLI